MNADELKAAGFDDRGRITEHLAVRDDVSKLQQLGHMPAPGG